MNIRFFRIALSLLIAFLSLMQFAPSNAEDASVIVKAESCWRQEGANGKIAKHLPKTCIKYNSSMEDWYKRGASSFFISEGAEFEISTQNLILLCADAFANSKSKFYPGGKYKFCKYGTGPKVKFDQDFSGSVSFTFIAGDPKTYKIPYLGIYESRIVETLAMEANKKLSEERAQNVCNEKNIPKGWMAPVAVNGKPIILNNDYVAPPKPTNPVNAWANKMGGGQLFKVEVLCPREADLRVLFPPN